MASTTATLTPTHLKHAPSYNMTFTSHPPPPPQEAHQPTTFHPLNLNLHSSLPWPSELLPRKSSPPAPSTQTQTQTQNYHATYLYLQMQMQMQILQRLSTSPSSSTSPSAPSTNTISPRTGTGTEITASPPPRTRAQHYRAIAPRAVPSDLQQDTQNKKTIHFPASVSIAAQ
ncbi:hypothetical protein L207DRAFT_520713 [Hyaloscypha variabilis F]|uniref:Uncharacterized protein n=1 Tax=Hyaloscypha variabilis (strain UAMH 11265 / GT02V1 / F) TaxID=1149755 RepID=A0A2J6QUD4_HYAVF|nr:hypothetical protein L207DRAFT_520713 [Hyaloscypha variabilis F]